MVVVTSDGGGGGGGGGGGCFVGAFSYGSDSLKRYIISYIINQSATR